MEGVNKRVLELMQLQNISKKEFADKTGISQVSVTHISSGRNQVSLSAAVAILESYPEINPDWLLLGKEPKYRQTDHLIALKEILEKVLESEASLDVKLESIKSHYTNIKREIVERLKL